MASDHKRGVTDSRGAAKANVRSGCAFLVQIINMNSLASTRTLLSANLYIGDGRNRASFTSRQAEEDRSYRGVPRYDIRAVTTLSIIVAPAYRAGPSLIRAGSEH